MSPKYQTGLNSYLNLHVASFSCYRRYMYTVHVETAPMPSQYKLTDWAFVNFCYDSPLPWLWLMSCL